MLFIVGKMKFMKKTIVMAASVIAICASFAYLSYSFIAPDGVLRAAVNNSLALVINPNRVITINSVTGSTFAPGSFLLVDYTATNFSSRQNFTIDLITASDERVVTRLATARSNRAQIRVQIPTKEDKKPFESGSYKIKLTAIPLKGDTQQIVAYSEPFAINTPVDENTSFTFTNPTGGVYVLGINTFINARWTYDGLDKNAPVSFALVNESNEVVQALASKSLASSNSARLTPTPSLALGVYKLAATVGSSTEVSYSKPFSVIQKNTSGSMVVYPATPDDKSRNLVAGRETMYVYFDAPTRTAKSTICLLSLQKDGVPVTPTLANGLKKSVKVPTVIEYGGESGTSFRKTRDVNGKLNPLVYEVVFDPDIVGDGYSINCVTLAGRVSSRSNTFSIKSVKPGTNNPTAAELIEESFVIPSEAANSEEISL